MPLKQKRFRNKNRAACSDARSEEHTSELQSQSNLVCRLLLEKKKYVTDKDDKLVGVLSLRQLLLVPPDKTLGSMVKPDVISVTTDTDQEEGAKLVARYNLLAIPVVDKEIGRAHV